MKEYSTKEEKIAAVKSLWREWAIAFGAVTAVVVASTLIDSLWLAPVVLAVAWGLRSWAESTRRDHSTGCMRFAALTASALFVASLIMAAINILYDKWSPGILFDPTTVNPDIPFIASLIIFPLTALVSAIGLINHGKSHFCRVCKTTHGYRPEEGFVGNFFHIQTRRQLSMMICLSIIIAATDWAYYALYYINININSSDRFFFVIIPAVLYLASLAYVGHHYYAVILDIRSQDDSHTTAAKPVIMRFLIIHDDMLLLDRGLHNLLDTPAECTHEIAHVSIIDASSAFSRMSGLNHDDFTITELYHNKSLTYRSTIYHYLVNIPDDINLNDCPAWHLQGQWATLATIDRLMKMHALAPALGAEIFRVYTIAMAWKTYDRSGRRRYPIKNYRPTFRLRDIHKWDVDYNDNTWLDIATNNQDKHMWQLRHLWRRIFNLRSCRNNTQA